MAFYIQIKKLNESSLFTLYEFSTTVVVGAYQNERRQTRSVTSERTGIMQIDKATGEIIILKQIEGDDRQIYSVRAAYKLRQHWENGAFPEITSYSA